MIGDDNDECEEPHHLLWPFLQIRIRPNVFYQLPTVLMDILDQHMTLIFAILHADARIIVIGMVME